MEGLGEGQTKGLDARIMAVRVMVMTMMVVMRRFRRQPGSDIGNFCAGIKATRAKQEIRRDIPGHNAPDRCAGIERMQPCFKSADLIRCCDIRLAQDQPVSNGSLLHRFNLGVQRCGAEHRIHHRHHAIKPEGPQRHRVAHQRLQNGGGVSQARGFNQHAANFMPAFGLERQVTQSALQIAADGAAQAASIEQHGIFIKLFDQQMVKPNLAEFIDKNSTARHIRMLQQPVQQRGLARAQKAGQHRDRNELHLR